jgi:hypothetical protein
VAQDLRRALKKPASLEACRRLERLIAALPDWFVTAGDPRKRTRGSRRKAMKERPRPHRT